VNLWARKLLGYSKSGPALNLWAGYFTFASAAICGICSIPLAVRFLDKEELGLWLLISQVIGYLIFLDLGIGASCGRILAEPLSSGNQDEIDKVWSSMVLLLSIAAGTMAVLGTGISPLVLEHFKIPDYLLNQAGFVFISSVLVNASLVPLRAVSGVLLCQERYYWSLIMQGVLPWFNLASFGLFLFLGVGIRAYVYASVVVAIVQYFWFRHLLATGSHKIRLRPRLVSWNSIKPILGYSSSIILWSIAPVVMASIPSFVIARHVGLEQLTIYNITSRIPTMMGVLAMRIYSAFFPRIQSLFVAERFVEFLPLFRLASNLSIWALCIFLSVASLLNPFAVDILAGRDFYGGTTLSLIFALGILLGGVGEHLGNLFIFAGKPKLISLVLGVEVALAFAVATLICPHFGVLGVAATIAIAPLFCRLPYYAVFGPKTIGFSLVELYRPGISAICGILLMMVAWWIAIHQELKFGMFLIVVPLVLAAFGAAIYSLRAALLDYRAWRLAVSSPAIERPAT
jgi:O-antigen/teichoic acid export membrane protein